MKIGIVTTWFERGAAYVSRQYKEILELAGHEVYVYARGGENDAVKESKWNGPNVTWGKRFSFPVPTYIDGSDFQQWLLKNSIEVAFFNEQRWLKPVVLCRKLKIKTGLYVDYYTEDTIKDYGIFDFLICNTRKHFSAFSWHEQAYYIPWGTDVELFNTANIRKKHKKVRFFNSSGMNPYRKGADLVVNAFSKAMENNKFKMEAELIIHTQVALQKHFSKLDGQSLTLQNINALQSSGSLNVIEGTVEAPGLYHKGDIYVYPSRLDGIGLTVAEAISCGMPVIVPDDGPMNEILPDTGSAVVNIEKYFCRADAYYWPQNEVSIDDLAKKMIEYIDNRERLPEYANISRAHALNKLNWKNNSIDIVNVFELSKFISVTPELESKAINAFTAGYPKIGNYESIYKFIYLIKSIIEKIKKR